MHVRMPRARCFRCHRWRRALAVHALSRVPAGPLCSFNNWDAVKEDRSAIQLSGGNLQVRGCDFQAPKPQVLLNPGSGATDSDAGGDATRKLPMVVPCAPPLPPSVALTCAYAGKAIITDNLMAGTQQITNLGAKALVVQNNAPDS